MPKLSKQEREEWDFYIDENGRRKYAGRCRDCVRDCKQSYRAKIVYCPRYICRQKKG
jgi:hypothetical protein